jgi:hypothetical protein
MTDPLPYPRPTQLFRHQPVARRSQLHAVRSSRRLALGVEQAVDQVERDARAGEAAANCGVGPANRALAPA